MAKRALMAFELYLVGVIIIVERLRRIFLTLIAGDPFHPTTCGRLRMIALSSAALGDRPLPGLGPARRCPSRGDKVGGAAQPARPGSRSW